MMLQWPLPSDNTPPAEPAAGVSYDPATVITTTHYVSIQNKQTGPLGYPSPSEPAREYIAVWS